MGWWGYGIFDGDTPYDCLGFLNDEINILEAAKKTDITFNIEDDYFELLHRKESFNVEQVSFIKKLLEKNIQGIKKVYQNHYDKSVYGTVLGAICLMYQVPIDKEMIKFFIEDCDAEICEADSFLESDVRIKHLNLLKENLEYYDKDKEYDFEKIDLFEQFSKQLGA